MSVRSETDLLTSPRECIFCNKNGLHNYHMLVDHLHTKNESVKRDIIRVRLDLPIYKYAAGIHLTYMNRIGEVKSKKLSN